MAQKDKSTDHQCLKNTGRFFHHGSFLLQVVLASLSMANRTNVTLVLVFVKQDPKKTPKNPKNPSGKAASQMAKSCYFITLKLTSSIKISYKTKA